MQLEVTDRKGLVSFYKKISFFIFLLPGVIGLSCDKSAVDDNTVIPPGNNNTPYSINYGDSILYLKTQSDDYIVYPQEQREGIYSGFPEGIEIDDKTGAINVSKSETGLRYLITHISPKGDTTETKIVLSGITFKDQLYYLSEGDSVAMPVYNANVSRDLPLNGSSFDDDGNANSGGCSVKTTDGQINLAQTLRNGVFGTTPSNDAKKEFDILYRLNDDSKKSLNKIRVKVYYYETVNDLSSDLIETLQSRQDDGVFIGLRTTNNITTSSTAKVTKAAKPRPPCIVVIAKK